MAPPRRYPLHDSVPVGRGHGPLDGRRYHFTGIGGSGMAPLAQLASAWGARVTGSDRNLDRRVAIPIFDALRATGITLLPQDGSGVTEGLDALVHSTAVEASNPDFIRAERLGIERVRRGSFLARLAAHRRTIAIAGTSGKSTVTAMTAHILVCAGLDPGFLGGGASVALEGAIPPGALRPGGDGWLVVETDESDGSVAEFGPAIATLTNLTRDHREVEVTAAHFARLLAQTSECAVINAGDLNLAGVPIPDALPRIAVALEHDATWTPPRWVAGDLSLGADAVEFTLERIRVRVPFPGLFTVENALLAVATASAAGVPLETAAAAMASFAGVRRRLERVGHAGGIDVFDDFAHNPTKIRASIEALQPRGALWVYYQPHGYGPTRFFAAELVDAFRLGLRPGDRLFLAPIYDAGGTADRSIRSEDLAGALERAGVRSEVLHDRGTALRRLAEEPRPGDRIVVMGARDDTLALFARSIAPAISARAESGASSRSGA